MYLKGAIIFRETAVLRFGKTDSQKTKKWLTLSVIAILSRAVRSSPPKGSKSDSRARDRTGNHLGSVLTWRCERDIITIRPRDFAKHVATVFASCSKHGRVRWDHRYLHTGFPTRDDLSIPIGCTS